MTVKSDEHVKKISGGSFKTMCLMNSLLKAIFKKGYNQPTPIQRKTIPLILEGKDVLAMARTGSGKTAAFVVPMIQKLKAHSIKTGIRGLILSPTRELALQTYDLIRELSKFTDLRHCSVIGGDSLESQFSALSCNPDIVVATPGRIMHICVESNLSLKAVEFVVFDEADRLFEMGFASQISDIISRLPNERQNALFSATLPSEVANFVKVGFSETVVSIRLDNEQRLSPNLGMDFLKISSLFKEAILLYLLKKQIYSDPNCDYLTIIFASTRHHVEYLTELLTTLGFNVVAVFGSMDQEARNISLSLFKERRVKIMVTTDVAARGLDIPSLDNVINYDFPASARLFIHRVGRVARAGNTGKAFSLVSTEDLAYYLDLRVLLGSSCENFPDLGTTPQSIIDEYDTEIKKASSRSSTIDTLKNVSINALKLYLKTRPSPTPESYRAAKELKVTLHPIFRSDVKDDFEAQTLISQIRNYKSKGSVLLDRDEKNRTQKNKKELYIDKDYYIDNNRKKRTMQLLDDVPNDEGLKTKEGKRTKKFVVTDDGHKVLSSMKSGTFEKWQKKTLQTIPSLGSIESDNSKRHSIANQKKQRYF